MAGIGNSGEGATRPDRKLVRHVAVMTGAAAGIGRAPARAGARAGADIALVDRDGDGGASAVFP